MKDILIINNDPNLKDMESKNYQSKSATHQHYYYLQRRRNENFTTEKNRNVYDSVSSFICP